MFTRLTEPWHFSFQPFIFGRSLCRAAATPAIRRRFPRPLGLLAEPHANPCIQYRSLTRSPFPLEHRSIAWSAGRRAARRWHPLRQRWRIGGRCCGLSRMRDQLPASTTLKSITYRVIAGLTVPNRASALGLLKAGYLPHPPFPSSAIFPRHFNHLPDFPCNRLLSSN
jgi:hypothetical protein